MFAHRTATGLTIALLALPATATAQVQPNPDNRPATATSEPPSPAVTATVRVRPNPDNRAAPAVTTPNQDLSSPDAIDAARAGQIARQMRHYHPQPVATVQAPVPSHGPDWPPFAFGGALLLTAAGGFAAARVRARRSARIVA